MRLSPRWWSRILIGYTLLASLWWGIHLWQQNDHLFRVERELLECRFSKNNSRGVNLSALEQTAEYQTIINHRERCRRMVLAEGIILSLCLIIGLSLVNRSVNREVALARQRRNFMLSITHELKSPLAALRLTMETFHRRELQREQVEKLSSNGLRDAARLQNLVEDLLLAARLEDRWRPLTEPLDLEKIVRDAVSSLKVRFPHANVDCHIPEHFAPVSADRSGLISVVQNLLENAVKYSPTGSPITLEAERTPSGRLRLKVADQGKGIPDTEKTAVFDKFYRLGNEETRQTTGTGLGLYIVNQVVKAHGGTIQILDNVPQGTIFILEI